MIFALQISTINLNRCGISAVDRVADFSCEFPFQIAALPEVDIPVHMAPGFIHAWKRRQMYVCLSKPESGVHRVALCSHVPFSPCLLNVDVADTRYAAGTFEVQGPDKQLETLLVVAVYFQARHEAVAQQQASDCCGCGRDGFAIRLDWRFQLRTTPSFFRPHHPIWWHTRTRQL